MVPKHNEGSIGMSAKYQMNFNAGKRSGRGTIADLIEARYAVIISNMNKASHIPDHRRRVIEVRRTGRTHSDVITAFKEMVAWLKYCEGGKHYFQHIVHSYIL